MIFEIKTIKYILIVFISFFFIKRILFVKNPSFMNYNLFNLSDYFINSHDLYFNLSLIEFSNIDRNIYQIEYFIDFYNKNKSLIIPSEITLYHKLQICCYIKDIQNYNIIISLPIIEKNTHFKCIEFFYDKQEIIFGIKVNNEDNSYFRIINLFSTSNRWLYKSVHNTKIYLSCSLFQEYYSTLINTIHNKSDNYLINKELKKSYVLETHCSTKKYNTITENKWHFRNIMNHSFCFCIGIKCLYKNVKEKCKYLLYLNIIDSNKDFYNKTDYLFNDFIYNGYSSDDAYPIFEEMIRLNIPVHYLTQNEDIYQKYCYTKNYCETIILVKEKEIIDGTFLQKYLTLFLKLKAVISGAEFYFIDNLFYKIDYITYISIGHGISYFKRFLYNSNSYYGNKVYNKILIPPSKKLIDMAKKYEWNDHDIIKINLPRWHFYDEDEQYFNKPYKNKSIFVMFTWRYLLHKENRNISPDYFDNINNLLNDVKLNKNLELKNITFYFTIHHKYLKYKTNILLNRNINYINETDISSILKITDLIVTDFSSIIFDIIYRGKPFVIFIPDSNQSQNVNNYCNNYVKLIQDLKDDKIKFENKFFTINETVNKIIYYINNNFKLEPELKKFYKSFGFKHYNGISRFINYLTNL